MPVGYSYYKTIALTGVSGAGANYSVYLTVGESALASGANFHLVGHGLNFPYDIRFTNADGTVDLDFYIEDVFGTAPNRTVRVWVEVQDNLNSAQSIRCYYGNASAVDASNFGNVFAVASTPWTESFESSFSWTSNGSFSRVSDKAQAGSWAVKATTGTTSAYRQNGWSEYGSPTTGMLMVFNTYCWSDTAGKAKINLSVGSGRAIFGQGLLNQWELIRSLALVNTATEGAPNHDIRSLVGSGNIWYDNMSIQRLTRVVVSPNPTFSSESAETYIGFFPVTFNFI